MISHQSSVIVSEASSKGKGVFANINFKQGEIVIVGKPVEHLPQRTWQTLQMDIDVHVRFDEPFELVNHSCNPNCGIKPNEFNGYNLLAMRDIIQGSEITFDYSMSEWISIAVKNCNCQTDICRGTIKGGNFLSSEIIDKYQGFLAPYYEKLIENG